ncbi:anti-CBASS protein Acb1 family protein [Paenibacillus glucanolyticus]|uniref:anti-CBASS protein Acb1 family protein n=1 Tax=Paenibacillus glucanolyticus TaxID=59843 RepID=UPI0035E01BA2
MMAKQGAQQRLDGMRNQYGTNYREDFLVGHGKAGPTDALSRQRVRIGHRRMTHEELQSFYAANQFVQNIIDIPAEDLTRNWITLKMKDEKLKHMIMRKLRELNSKEVFTDMRRYERLHGDGFVAIGANQSASFKLGDPLKPEQLRRIDYLHAFSSYKVGSFQVNEDMFSPTYGQVEMFQVNRRSQLGTQIAGTDDGYVHRSRLFHDQTRRLESDLQGQSVIEPMYDVLTVFDTALWSVGQILYDYTFKRYKTPGVEALSKEEKQEFAMLSDFMFRTEALAVIGENEDIDKVTTNTSGIKDLLDFVWEALAGASKMPKSVIKGQESGTIAGAQYDVLNYYSRIAAAQETELRPHLERLIRYLLICSDDIGGRMDPEKVEWELVFNPLWNVDQETDAKIRKMNAESDSMYIASGVLDPDQVREQRFPQYESSESELSTDSMSEEEMREFMKAARNRFEE